MSGANKNGGDLGVLLRRSAVDPRRFEELLAAWNAQFDPEKGLHGPSSLTAAACDALTVIEGAGEPDDVRPDIARMINALPYSVVVVSGAGIVRGMNTLAMARLDLEIDGQVDALGYQLMGGELISRVVARTLDELSTKGDTALERGVHHPSGRIATIAIVAAGDRPHREASALLFIIDPEQPAEAKAMMARAYGLTSAEGDVLAAFLGGESLADIAERRNRSLATVRTQFQRILSKSDAASQAELMRNALALSQFVSEVSDIAEVARHPHRREAQILRPGGRRVALVLAGDLAGTPLIFLSTLTHHTLPAEVETRFKSAGLLAVHLWRPGFGGTDPPGRREAYADAMCGDVAAVLAQLGFSRGALVALNSSTRDAIDLGGRLVDQVSRIFVLGPVLPRPFQRRRSLRTPWAEAIYRATASNPILLRVMVRAGLRAWNLLGTRRFVEMQLGGSAADMAAIAQPGVIAEFDRAMTESNAQGTGANISEAIRITADWSDLVGACRVPIELLHGTEDPCTDISLGRAFAAAFTERVAVTEFPGAGFYSLFSHPDEVLASLANADLR